MISSRANISQHGQMIANTYYMHTDQIILKNQSHLRNLSWLPQIANGSVIQFNSI